MKDLFYFRWIIANVVAECLGLGTTLLLGRFIAQRLEVRPGPTAIIFGAFAAVLLGIALEGVLVGIAQGWVIRERMPMFPIRDWVVATSIGAGIAWMLGMVPSTAIALIQEGDHAGTPDAAAPQPSAWLRYLLAVGMGLVLGPVLALAQVWVLRRFTPHPYRWLWANAFAWAVGMLVIFVGMHLVPWHAGPVAVALATLAVCAIAGAAVGTVHGWYLRQMLAPTGANTIAKTS